MWILYVFYDLIIPFLCGMCPKKHLLSYYFKKKIYQIKNEIIWNILIIVLFSESLTKKKSVIFVDRAFFVFEFIIFRKLHLFRFSEPSHYVIVLPILLSWGITVIWEKIEKVKSSLQFYDDLCFFQIFRKAKSFLFTALKITISSLLLVKKSWISSRFQLELKYDLKKLGP